MNHRGSFPHRMVAPERHNDFVRPSVRSPLRWSLTYKQRNAKKIKGQQLLKDQTGQQHATTNRITR